MDFPSFVRIQSGVWTFGKVKAHKIPKSLGPDPNSVP